MSWKAALFDGNDICETCIMRRRDASKESEVESVDVYANYKVLYILLTYLLTPWSRVLLEKLTGSAASQEIPRIFGTPRFITVLTSARHLSLS